MTSATEIQKWGEQEMRRINDIITGRCGIYDQAAGLWAWCVWNAHHQDVLDIGTAFGASAILAARVKQQYGLRGVVCTLDDFSATGKWQSSQSLAEDNCEKLKVNALVVNSASNDIFFNDGEFGAVLIDGGHDGDQPLRDWQKFGVRSDWVMFHDTGLPAVKDAIAVAKENHDFVLAADRNNCAVFRRIYG